MLRREILRGSFVIRAMKHPAANLTHVNHCRMLFSDAGSTPAVSTKMRTPPEASLCRT